MPVTSQHALDNAQPWAPLVEKLGPQEPLTDQKPEFGSHHRALRSCFTSQWCHDQNACVPPEFTCWNPSAQRDTVEDGALEVTGS